MKCISRHKHLSDILAIFFFSIEKRRKTELHTLMNSRKAVDDQLFVSVYSSSKQGDKGDIFKAIQRKYFLESV